MKPFLEVYIKYKPNFGNLHQLYLFLCRSQSYASRSLMVIASVTGPRPHTTMLSKLRISSKTFPTLRGLKRSISKCSIKPKQKHHRMKLGNDIFAAVHSILLLWSVCRGSLLFSPEADQLPGTKVVLECHKTLRPYHRRLNGKYS